MQTLIHPLFPVPFPSLMYPTFPCFLSYCAHKDSISVLQRRRLHKIATTKSPTPPFSSDRHSVHLSAYVSLHMLELPSYNETKERQRKGKSTQPSLRLPILFSPLSRMLQPHQKKAKGRTRTKLEAGDKNNAR
mmetsp:Transcript_2222/g.4677  ORF Transcript_2222/g.4677 Transcript_2222/m.4677 type:complete len:133 (-) Transcript_2222:432-830(-)